MQQQPFDIAKSEAGALPPTPTAYPQLQQTIPGAEQQQHQQVIDHQGRPLDLHAANIGAHVEVLNRQVADSNKVQRQNEPTPRDQSLNLNADNPQHPSTIVTLLRDGYEAGQRFKFRKDKFPTLENFLHFACLKFEIPPRDAVAIGKLSLRYLLDGQLLDVTDSDGWEMASDDLASGRATSITLRGLPPFPTHFYAPPPAHLAAVGLVDPLHAAQLRTRKRKRRSDASAPPQPDAPEQLSMRQEQRDVWEAAFKHGGQQAAWNALDRTTKTRYIRVLEIMEAICGSKDYVLNPMQIACPVCGRFCKLKVIADQQLYNLFGGPQHMNNVHVNKCQDPAIINAATELIERYDLVVRKNRKVTELGPLSEATRATLIPPPPREGEEFLPHPDRAAATMSPESPLRATYVPAPHLQVAHGVSHPPFGI
ncbi:hypothetical protein HDV00_003752 [Rhizophlyctis rosea]|nr:hypothetical protein HDV00_003752 [Rhizophlyctis rosea]